MESEAIFGAALTLGYISDERRGHCRDLVASEGITAAEALVRLAGLTRDQLRGVLVLARYERGRREDEALGAFIVHNGFLPQDVLRSCLEEQGRVYEAAEEYPRLADILVQRGHATPEQIQTVIRTRMQVESARLQMGGGGTPATVWSAPPETVARASAASAARTVTTASVDRPTPAAAITDEAYKKHSRAAGALAEKFTLSLRRTRLKDASKGEMTIIMLDLDGHLHDEAAGQLDTYVHELIGDGATRLALNMEKLNTISDAGIQILAGAARRCQSAKGDLRLCNVTDKVRKALELNPVARSLKVYDGERGVIMSFKYM